MRAWWWKIMGLGLLAYVIIGGLFTPLKTGITGVSAADSGAFNITSANHSKIFIDIYNPGADFKVEEAVLANGSKTFKADTLNWNKEGQLTANFEPRFGKNGASETIYNLFVKANGQWMSFPNAIGIKLGAADTLSSNSVKLRQDEILANPDKMKGFPNRIILYESIRNLLYHVPMWFSMIFLLCLAALYAMRYLNTGNLNFDLRSDALIRTAILAGLLGCLTGSAWASVTWGSWWPRDPKLNGVAIGMVMYLAYLLLRNGMRDEHQRARIASVYNLFVFPIFISLIVIMPKLAGDSLHPGAGGTVTFKQYDLDNTLRLYFYPAIIGWICIFAWMASMLYRYKKLETQINYHE
jgi:heme exporter protein C